MNNIIKNMPIAISGTLLAVLSIGNLFEDNLIKSITFILGLTIILILLLKLVYYRKELLKELSNPVILSTSGTFSMAVMVLSTYIVNTNYYLSLIIWLIGVLLHLLLIIYYTIHHIILDFNIEKYYGSLWVVYIGLTMASISGGILELHDISWIFFVFGLIVMIPSFILVSYRYIKYPVKTDANKPLICIYAAIFNILTVGYYYSFNTLNTQFITTLYIIGLILYIFSLYQLIKHIRLPFYPSYSAFTFPFVISAIATTKMILIQNNMILTSISKIETIIATILVIYVLYEYVNYIIQQKET